MKAILTTLLLYIAVVPAQPQTASLGKLSPWLRHIVATSQEQPSRRAVSTAQRQVCAFVRLTDDLALPDHGSRSLAQVGDIHVASIPLAQLKALSADSRVVRIEARPMGHVLLDTLSHCINAAPAHQGINLPQAFTGKGVVVGVMDIGFDLTHPTFYSRDLSTYRIQALWDMLSTDTVGSPFIVGRDYTGRDALLTLAHSYDGLHQTHGTHTSGIAAGSGYDSPYQGVAPEADLCLVANAVSDNADLIDSTLYDRFTFATDALGFKYIFDYATGTGKPCVASFSEGSSQDFWGYDLLYYEMLDRLVGPGRILVAAAGNQGDVKSWFCKESDTLSKGSFLQGSKSMHLTLKSADPFTLRLVSYGSEYRDTLLLTTGSVCSSRDSLLTCHLSGIDSLQVQAYPSCYSPDDVCYDLQFFSQHSIGFDQPLSLELLGLGAYVELWRGSASLVENALNPFLYAGEKVRNVHSPSSAPRVISVGATTYRDSILNKDGQWMHAPNGPHGSRAAFSSVGPTMDGRVKPDVMAPGNNIISSYSSFYLETHPDRNDIKWNVKEFTFGDRLYPWNSNAGTSMSCPAVAGAIALWLQANPDLTPEEVMGILQRTCRQPDPSLSYPNNYYGYGEIDVYRGLLDILQVDRIDAVSPSHTPSQIRVASGRLTISLAQPCANGFTLRIFTLDGRQRLACRLPSGQSVYSVDLPPLPTGIYAVQLDGSPEVSGSTLIRIP